MSKLFTLKRAITFLTTTGIFRLFDIPSKLGVTSPGANFVVNWVVPALAPDLLSALKSLKDKFSAATPQPQQSVPLTALQCHVAAFAEKPLPNGNLVYNEISIAKRLFKAGSKGACLKGSLISGFNTIHSGSSVCPFANGVLANDKSIAKSLHLGTTRIWDKNGNIDEVRYRLFIRNCQTNHSEFGGIFTLKDVKNYLLKCSSGDPEEKDTGRNALSMFSSKHIQLTAAIKAWDELFNTYKTGTVDGEPYLDALSMNQFFRNTGELVRGVELNYELSKLKAS